MTAPDRIIWATGDRLTAADLRHADAAERRLRALHMRVVHGTWGIVRGLEVKPMAAGDAVEVSAGLAHDACGAEIVLWRAVRVPAPRDGTWDLLAAAGATASRLRWAAPGRDRRGDVPLARVAVAAGTISGGTSAAPRVRAAGADGTRIASGRAWLPVGHATAAAERVSTAAAGFRSVPAYVAQLEDAPAQPGAALGPLLAIEAARRDSFDVAVRAYGQQPPAAALVAVAWIGIEEGRGP